MSFIQSWEDPALDANATSISVTVTGATPGNKLLAVLSVRVHSNGFGPDPTGWTYVNGEVDMANSSIDTAIYERTATGDSNDDFSQTWNLTNRAFCVIAEYSGLTTSSPTATAEDLGSMTTFSAVDAVTGDATGAADSTAVAILSAYDWAAVVETTTVNSTKDYFRSTGDAARPGSMIGTFASTGGTDNDSFAWSTGSRAYGAILVYANAGATPVPPQFDGPDISNQTGTVSKAITPIDVSGLYSGTQTPFTYIVTPSGDPFPNGITIDSETGIISGTPVAAQSRVGCGIRVEDTDGAFAYSNLFDWTISSASLSITTQPQSAVVTEPTGAVFTVVATSTETLSYQWKADGVNVGTNSATYNTGATSVSQSGSVITCVVTDINGSVTTDGAATLTVYAASSGVSVKSYDDIAYTSVVTAMSLPITTPAAGDIIVVTSAYYSGTAGATASAADNNLAPLTQAQAYTPGAIWTVGGTVWWKISDGTETSIDVTLSELCTGGVAAAVYSGLSVVDASVDDLTYVTTNTNTFNSGNASATSSGGVAVYCAMPGKARRWFGEEVSITNGTLHGTCAVAGSAPQPFMAYEIFNSSGTYGTTFNTTDLADGPAYGAAVILGANVVTAPISWDGGVVTAPDGAVGGEYSLDIGSGFSGSAIPFTYAQTAGTDITTLGLSLDADGVIVGAPMGAGELSGIVITGTDQDNETDAPAPFAITIAEVSATLPVDAGAFASQGFNANLYTGLGITPLVADTGGFVTSGYWAELTLGSNEIIFSADPAVFDLTGFEVEFSQPSENVSLPADAGAFTLEGFDARLYTGMTTYTFPLDEGSGVVGACVESSEWDAVVNPSSWREVDNSVKWPINEGTGALLSEVQTGTSEYDATIQNFDESGWD